MFFYKMELVLVFECECNPGKVYASKATFSSHKNTLRHQRWKLEVEKKELRVNSEHETRRLKRRIVELEELVRNLCAKPRARRVSETTKKKVASGQAWKCAECKCLLPSCYEVDHIIPLWKNGSNRTSNLRALCRNCHGCKTQNDMVD